MFLSVSKDVEGRDLDERKIDSLKAIHLDENISRIQIARLFRVDR